MNEGGDAGGCDVDSSGGGSGCGGGCSGGDGGGGGESWWNAGVGINGVLEKRADLAATGVTCRDDQCRCGDSAREKFEMIFSHRRTMMATK